MHKTNVRSRRMKDLANRSVTCYGLRQECHAIRGYGRLCFRRWPAYCSECVDYNMGCFICIVNRFSLHGANGTLYWVLL